MPSCTMAAALPISIALWNPAWDAHDMQAVDSFEQLRDIDAWAREKAAQVLAATRS